MRLINTYSLELTEFLGDTVPPYAILSHAWTDDEITFGDMASGSDRAALSQRKGYRKIVGCCAKARSDGLSYAWVDTCCIDKSSSAELSEAINSMFQWYRSATVCYAYLDDVPSDEDPASSSTFRRSRWFTRGWTLQELLAPYEVVFLAEDWLEIGSKRSLRRTVAAVTNIDELSLVEGSWAHVSVAAVLSWASRRRTTRVEDGAYCLMGLFDVHMPLIYGEGEKTCPPEIG